MFSTIAASIILGFYAVFVFYALIYRWFKDAFDYRKAMKKTRSQP